MPSISSVTVATNAARILPAQLDALIRQSHPLSEIIVVDNASTDGTSEMLKSQYPQITVVNLPKNAGVGGGFSAGLSYAVTEKNYDWVWLLDDDSVPEDNALAALLDGLTWLGDSTDIGLLASLPRHSANQTSYPGMIWRHGFVRPRGRGPEQPAWFVDAVISSGSLVRGKAVMAVGLPRADFFMDFVDFEYCLRLRRHNYKIALVRDSRLNHAIGTPRIVTVLGFSKLRSDQPAWREYYLSRNYTYTVWNYYSDWKSKLMTVKWLLRHSMGVIALGRDRLACLRMVIAGFNDGRAGRLGIRFIDDVSRESQPTETEIVQPARAVPR